jgi:endonuclease/exonuclease/phosphatase family metal-dependent hydrolase
LTAAPVRSPIYVPGGGLLLLRDEPRVLLGDLNMPAGPVRAFTGWRPLARAATFPSPSPKTQLDHVLADPRGAAALGRVVQVRTPPVGVSDHRPLVVRLDR